MTRTALLIHFLAPYKFTLSGVLRDRVARLRAFLSTPMERDQDWAAEQIAAAVRAVAPKRQASRRAIASSQVSP